MDEHIIETWEDEPCVGPYCKDCGAEMDWVDCYAGCDDGYFDGYEEDPLWYDPGDLERCETCQGKSGWWECFACQEKARAG